MDDGLPILFTVFEPSGDVLAARLIEEVRRRQPGRRVFAFGGPKMQAAGAELIEQTTQHAKMGVGVGMVGEAKELLRRKQVLAAWLKENPIAAHVPTDSPAANWSLCAAVRKVQPDARIVHLVGPQIWAWATWRIRRLRRLTDHVMCLLPFEPEWFGSRGVASTFVGHPLFDPPTQTAVAAEGEAETSGESGGGGAGGGAAGGVRAIDGQPMRPGQTKLALLPGSREKEVRMNWPTMLKVFDQLRHRLPDLAVVIAAADRARADQLKLLCPGGRPPRGMQVVLGEASEVLDWADAAVVVSGTATLEAASRNTPMVVIYNGSLTAWKLLGRYLISARTFALPNVIGQAMELERIVPEFVPHDGSPEPVIEHLRPLLTGGASRETQLEGFDSIRQAYAGKVFRRDAADVLLQQIESGREQAEQLEDDEPEGLEEQETRGGQDPRDGQEKKGDQGDLVDHDDEPSRPASD